MFVSGLSPQIIIKKFQDLKNMCKTCKEDQVQVDEWFQSL